MFRGRFVHTLDSKGRVSIPTKFREILRAKYDGHLIITNWDRCLLTYPSEEWKKIEKRLSILPGFGGDERSCQRFFMSGATECTIDPQGRVLIPPSLREYAELDKEVVFVGMITGFEVWSKQRWDEEMKRLQGNLEKIGNALNNALAKSGP